MSTIFNFFRESPFNPETKHQLWLSGITDFHDTFCGCTQPYIHLLSILYTEEHKDRHLTIHQIVSRGFREQKCLFGGQEETNIGMAIAALKEEDGTQKGDAEGLTDENIEELIAATDAAEEDDQR